MRDPADAQWIIEVLDMIQSPQADLVKDLLEHMSELRDGQREALWLDPSGSPPDKVPGTRKSVEVEEKRKRLYAVYRRLREAWQFAKNMPPSSKQCEILLETAHFRVHDGLQFDPLSEQQHTALSIHKAKDYAHKALAISESLDDAYLISETNYVLARCYDLETDYNLARVHIDKCLDIARQIGNIHLQVLGQRHKHHIIVLQDVGPAEQIEFLVQYVIVLGKLGDANLLIAMIGMLARLYLVLGELAKGLEELEKIEELIGRIPQLSPHQQMLVAHYYYGVVSYHAYKEGRWVSAISHQKTALLSNIKSSDCREDFLWYDLAWFERLCLLTGRQEEFRLFCDELKSYDRFSDLRDWYLTDGVPTERSWDEEWGFGGTSLPAGWHWVDPLNKSSYTIDQGLAIQPTIGVGVFSNVYVPRLVKSIEGDFAFETTLAFDGNRTKAGGILVYHDDLTLIRFGVGIQDDGEISLTVKSPDYGFYTHSRGMIDADIIRMRIEREEDLFRAWCGDCKHWYKCGEVTIDLSDAVKVGAYAECAYRQFSTKYNVANPLTFRSIALQQCSSI